MLRLVLAHGGGFGNFALFHCGLTVRRSFVAAGWVGIVVVVGKTHAALINKEDGWSTYRGGAPVWRKLKDSQRRRLTLCAIRKAL